MADNVYRYYDPCHTAFGITHEGRLILLYTFESDLGDGWENPEIHNDPQEVRIKALRMGANIIGYAFETNDVVSIAAYSGKPVNMLVAMDLAGEIKVARVLEHNEPILLAGIPVSKLEDAVLNYRGKNIRDQIKVGKPQAGCLCCGT